MAVEIYKNIVDVVKRLCYHFFIKFAKRLLYVYSKLHDIVINLNSHLFPPPSNQTSQTDTMTPLLGVRALV